MDIQKNADIARGIFEQLGQIIDGYNRQQPIWDGNLIDKNAIDKLCRSGLVDRACGFSFPTEKGRNLYAILTWRSEKSIPEHIIETEE